MLTWTVLKFPVARKASTLALMQAGHRALVTVPLSHSLKLWVMVDSGELSMTRVLPLALPALEFVAPELEPLDEHAARPAASRPAAPTARNRL